PPRQRRPRPRRPPPPRPNPRRRKMSLRKNRRPRPRPRLPRIRRLLSTKLPKRKRLPAIRGREIAARRGTVLNESYRTHQGGRKSADPGGRLLFSKVKPIE